MPLLLFLVVVFLYVYAEISLLVSMGAAIGVLPLIFLMLSISMLGLWLIKARGAFTLWQVRKDIANGQIPTQALGNSLFFVVAGVMFLIPGFLSDIVALLLLLPVTRHLIQTFFMRFLAGKVSFFSFVHSQQSAQQSATTFEAEFEHKSEDNQRLK